MSAAREGVEALLGSALQGAGPFGLPLAAPENVDDAARLVRLAAQHGWRVLPLGLGSKLGWCAPPRECDLALSTRRLTGIVAHAPEDGTLTALAGTRWSELRAAAREHGHELTPEISGAQGSTLGGVLAAGQSGFDRLRHGPLRAQVLGVRALLADGSLAQSGGRLVKNVTGYDLHRLYTGSQGTLCLILEASLRLHPRPEGRAVALERAATRAEALEKAQRLLRPPHAPWALIVHDLGPDAGGAAWSVAALLAARPEVLEWQLGELRRAWPRAALHSSASADAARVEALWDGLRELERAGDDWAALHASCPPARLAAAAAELERVCGERRIELRLLLHPGLATLDAWLRPLDAEAVCALSQALRAAGAQPTWRALDPGLRAAASIADPEPAGAALMRRIKAALDPDGLWAPGRFVAGI